MRRHKIRCSSGHYSVDTVEHRVEELYRPLRLDPKVQEQIRAELRQDLTDRQGLIAQSSQAIRPPRFPERFRSSQDHIFFEKLLDSGELLQTHISHSRGGRPSTGRFASILRHQIKVSRTEFWQALRSGEPVARPVPVPVEAEQVEHEAWVVAVLAGDLHMTAEEIAMLDAEYARQLVLDHWSRPTAP